MDRDFVHRNLRKLELMRHVFASLFKTITSHPLENFQARYDNASMVQQAAKKLNEEISTYIATYSKPECLTLAKMVQSKLPRELRDMVYDHLLPREIYTVGRPGYTREWLQSLRQTNCDHLFMEEYVPLDAMKEIGEMWYEVSTFMVLGFPFGRDRNPRHASVGFEFLGIDSWGLDIDVLQHVKHLHIRLAFNRDYIEDNVIQLDANLRELLYFNEIRHVVIQVQSTDPFSRGVNGDDVEGFVKKFVMVFPALEALIRQDKRVSVTLRGIFDVEVKLEELNERFWQGEFRKVWY